MDPILSLIGDLYTQIQALQKELDGLKAKNAELELAAIGEKEK